MYNAGEINVAASGSADARALSNTMYNESNADADATTEARVSGIRAEKGTDVVINRGLITADATAAAFSLAQGSNIGGTEQDLKSKITADGQNGTTIFIDETQKDLPADEFVGKSVRFLTSQNLDGVRLVVGFGPKTGQFT